MIVVTTMTMDKAPFFGSLNTDNALRCKALCAFMKSLRDHLYTLPTQPSIIQFVDYVLGHLCC